VAKKSKVPAPPRSAQTSAPRPVQAPKTRKESRGPRDPRTTKLILGGIVGAIAVVAVIVVVVLVTGGGSSASAALAAAGCTETTFPAQGRQHVPQLEKGFKYNSFPATSGPHNPQTALWNLYTEPVPFVNQVHNLEHGGIVVQYGDQVPAEAVQQISDWYAQDPTALLVAPLPALKDKVAFSAWTQLAICPGFDPGAASAFRDQHIFEGPEKFPANQLQPGM
jgi:hypothetical protein